MAVLAITKTKKNKHTKKCKGSGRTDVTSGIEAQALITILEKRGLKALSPIRLATTVTTVVYFDPDCEKCLAYADEIASRNLMRRGQQPAVAADE